MSRTGSGIALLVKNAAGRFLDFLFGGRVCGFCFFPSWHWGMADDGAKVGLSF